MSVSRLVTALVFLLTGCGPALPDQVLEGRWVRYHYGANEGAPCPEAIAEMDRFVDLLAERTARPPPGDFRIDYFRLRTLREIRQLCQPHASACAIGSKIYSLTTIQDHELTHAFLSRLGEPPLLFTEGIAVAFGCGDARWAGEPVEPAELVPLIDNAAWAESLTLPNYQAAGGFVRQLVDEHGLEAFLGFYAATPSGVTRDELNAQFRTAFREELDDAVARWKQRPAQRDGEYCLPLQDRCDGPPDFSVSAGAAATRASRDVSCLEQVSTLEVTDAAVTRLRFIAEKEGRRLRLRPCDRSGSPAQQLLYVYSNTGSTLAMPGRWTELWGTLKPGRYSLTVDSVTTLMGETALGGSATIEVSPAPAALGPSCSVAPVPIGDDTWSIAFFDQAAPSSAFVVLEPMVDRRIAGLFGAGLQGPVTLCQGCTTPSSCQPLEVGSLNSGFLRGPSTSFQLTPSADAGSTFFKLVLEAP